MKVIYPKDVKPKEFILDKDNDLVRIHIDGKGLFHVSKTGGVLRLYLGSQFAQNAEIIELRKGGDC